MPNGIGSAMSGGDSLGGAISPSKDALSSIIGEREQEHKLLVEKAQQTGEKIRGYESQRQGMGDFPQMQPIPKAPDLDPKTDPKKAWGSIAMMVAVFGSLLTRAPMTNAMNAAAGVMQAFRKNDLDAAEHQFKVWKANTDNAIALNNYQVEKYKAALAKIDAGEKGAVAELNAYSKAFGDDVTPLLLQKSIAEAQKHTDNLAHWGEMMAIQNARLSFEYDKERTRQEDNNTRQSLFENLQLARANNDEAGVAQATQAITDFNMSHGKGISQKMPTTEKQVLIAKTKADHPEWTTQQWQDFFASPAYQNATSAAAGSKLTGATNTINDISNAIAQAEGGVGVTGIAGFLNRRFETLKTIVSEGETPAHDFEGLIDTIKTEIPKLLANASRVSAEERAHINVIVRGLSPGDTRSVTIRGLEQIQDILIKHYSSADIQGTSKAAGEIAPGKHGAPPIKGALWSNKTDSWVVRDPASPSGWSKVESGGE